MCRRFDLICFLPLYGEAAQFSWLRRMKIAIGITQGLRYLYTESQPPFAISDLNSNSIYVTTDFMYKLNFEIHFRQLLMTWQKSFLWAGWRRRLLKPHRRRDGRAPACTWVWEDRSASPAYTRPCQRLDAGFIIRLRRVSKAIHLSSFSSDPFYCDIAFKSINFYDSFSVKENRIYLNKLRV